MKYDLNDMQKSIDKIDRFLGLKRGIEVSKAIRDNAKIALSDIKSGEIYKNDQSLKNLIDVTNDILKGSLIGTGYIVIPGSIVLFPIIRRLLQKSKIEKIRKLLELTVDKDI